MISSPTPAAFSLERLSAHKERVAGIRRSARQMLDDGVSGLEIAGDISQAVDELLISLYRDAVDGLSPDDRLLVERHAAMIAVGGTGRGELCPYSDVDLLFLFRKPARDPFVDCAAQVVRDCWDSGIELGHSVRTVGDSLALARDEPEVATGLVEARWLAGDRQLFKSLRRKVRRHIGGQRARRFIDACLNCRESERAKHGGSVTCLEPDVKRSLGGLRDLHLIRWIGCALFGRTDIDALRRRGALSVEDARLLHEAHEFLTRVRIDLHLAAGRGNDFLSRDEQLRIAERAGGIRGQGAEVRGPAATSGGAPSGPASQQRPVERLMQTYFRHSTAIAGIARRFVAIHRPQSARSRLVRFLGTHRADRFLRVGGEHLDAPHDRERVCRSFEQILSLYRTCALYGVLPAPPLAECIRRAMGLLSAGDELSDEAASQFLHIMSHGGEVGPLLRSMYDTGVLEHAVPAMTHARCLLQFNQYHSYTVDEHSLRAVEAVDDLAREESPVGLACRQVRHQEILRLALLLHDLGKGYDEDHSEVGKRIAEETARRLGLPDEKEEMLVFLVHRHLFMSHVGLRRDTSDPDVLLPFSHAVGSPELLRMLYVLTAADLTAVGPGVWNSWKADLLAGLFDRSMLILSGKPYRYVEEERLRAIKEHVLAAVRSDRIHAVPAAAGGRDDPMNRVTTNPGNRVATNPGSRPSTLDSSHSLAEWVDRQTGAFSAHYLVSTTPEQIAADLNAIRGLQPGEVIVEGRNEDETGTVDYRIIAAADLAEGCFHKLAGVLTAKRLEILTARICTTADGTVVDSFRVFDDDYAGAVPPERIDDVAAAITATLTRKMAVERLFQRYLPFDARDAAPVSNLPPRVVIDNDSSDYATIVDVFAHDRPGLLYTISRAIYELGLSVALARISTHSDQVVDVFYVTDADGHKLVDEERLKETRLRLEQSIREFENAGRLVFAS